MTAETSASVSLWAGGAAGVVTDVSLFPLDVLKTRLQAKGLHAVKYNDLYKGFFPTVVGSFPSAAAFFVTYDLTKHALSTSEYTRDMPDSLKYGTAAALGEVVSCGIRIPFELVKQRMQVGLHTSAWEGVRAIYKAQGFGGLYVGYLSTVLREVPFDAIQFTLWEKLKTFTAKKMDVEKVSPFVSALCGTISGAGAAFVTTPLDVAKTRIMTQNHAAQEYHGTFDCMRKIYAQEGVKRLFSGAVARVTWVSLGGFVFFGTVEVVKELFSSPNSSFSINK